MSTIELLPGVEFLSTFVKLALDTKNGRYCHSPYQMLVRENTGESYTLGIIMDENVLPNCLAMFQQNIWDGAPAIFWSSDYSARNSMEHDFIFILCWYDQTLSYIAQPYDSKTGHKFGIITGESKNSYLEEIFEQFKYFLL